MFLMFSLAFSYGHERTLEKKACAVQLSSKVVKASLSLRIARKLTRVKPMIKFSQLIRRNKLRLETNFYKKHLQDRF